MKALCTLILTAALVTLGCGGGESPVEETGGQPATPAPAAEAPEPAKEAASIDVSVLDYTQALPATSDFEAIFPSVTWSEREPAKPLDRANLFRICGEFPKPGVEGTGIGSIATWKTVDPSSPNFSQTTFVDIFGFANEGDLDAAWQEATKLSEECNGFETGSFKDPYRPRKPSGTPALENVDVLVFQGANTRGPETVTVMIVRRGPVVAQAQIGGLGVFATKSAGSGIRLAGDIQDRFPTADQLQKVGELLLSGIEKLEG